MLFKICFSEFFQDFLHSTWEILERKWKLKSDENRQSELSISEEIFSQ